MAMLINRDFPALIKMVVNNYVTGFNLKPKQVECLSILTEKECDLIASLPTGYGKSVIAHLIGPLLKLKHGTEKCTVLVICPLNVIHNDQLRSLKDKNLNACRIDINAHAHSFHYGDGDDDTASATASVTDSDSDCDRYDDASTLQSGDTYCNELQLDVPLDEILANKFDIVFLHPEALFSTRKGRLLLETKEFTENVLCVVIDECHTVEKWSNEFRTAFQELKTLPAFFTKASFVGLSGTLTTDDLKKLPVVLGLRNPEIVQENPDRPNIYLAVAEKGSNVNVVETYESIYMRYCDELKEQRDKFPVTLLYLPLQWISAAQYYLSELFGSRTINNSSYAVVYSKQDSYVTKQVTIDLKQPNPRIRLVLCTSCVGMGFDSPAVTRIIHGKPPRCLNDYAQQIGRAGRCGQLSEAVLYYNRSDIAANVAGLKKDIVAYCTTKECLRLELLKNYGFYEPKVPLSTLCKCCSICQKNVNAILAFTCEVKLRYTHRIHSAVRSRVDARIVYYRG